MKLPICSVYLLSLSPSSPGFLPVSSTAHPKPASPAGPDTSAMGNEMSRALGLTKQPVTRPWHSGRSRGAAHTCFGQTCNHMAWKSKLAKVPPVIQVMDPAKTWLFSRVSLRDWNDMETRSSRPPAAPPGHAQVSQQDVPNRDSTRKGGRQPQL